MLLACIASACFASEAPFSTDGNRLTYLDSDNPFHPHRGFAKLTTPQWVGEEGVEAVVVLAIDDMRSNEAKYETMLRPILNRLKQVDGRAPVSIMVNTFAPTNLPLLKSWLAEGVSLECHTIAHPCPLCQKASFENAATNFHACVDLLHSIPGNRPVAFRMPCCDSMNSPTPRFFTEIFDRSSAQRTFLAIDSSVMVVLTTNDPALPRALVMDEQGRERFRKYLPAETTATTKVSMGSFTTTIEDFPYPYLINRSCWEFPCIVPSDWEASNLHGSTNAATVEDWKRALDAVVLKQGTMTFIFHPHGWIRSEQMVAFIDYAVATYGKKVKFLNFKEAEERLTTNLFKGQPMRDANGSTGAAQLLDLDNDGYMDVVLDAEKAVTRLWQPQEKRWREVAMPYHPERPFSRSGVVEASGRAAMVGREARHPLWQFTGETWQKLGELDDLRDTSTANVDCIRFRDINRDGVCELILSGPDSSAIFARQTNGWRKLEFTLPAGTSIVDAQGRDAGLRFVDVDGDGYDDILFSNAERYSLHLFRKDDRKLRLKPGWSDEVLSGQRGDPLTDAIPPIVRAGTNRNNGVWFARNTMWVQNEDTAHLPDRVDRRTFAQLLGGYMPKPLESEAALHTLRVPDGFHVELAAAEPLIADPIAFEWAADGRLWVVEMGDYPLGLDGKGRPGGRVRVLEDRDGDGRYDHATTFLEGLNFPTGLYPWRKGVVISGAPEILYAEDTNGDGRADVREVLFTGFTEGNQQHRINGFDYGLDGWLYAANGDSGGNVRAAGISASAPLSLRGHDVRLHPDKRRIETVAGQTQYGRHRDDWGNWFGNNNPTWLWHYFFPEQYLARNPYLAIKSLKRVLANDPESTRCFPISRTLSRFNDPFAANHVTSGCSAMPYRDDAFGETFAHAVFVCEPVHNLVHCEVLSETGATFESHRLPDETNSEFFASTDNWFRPVYAKTGPDGALYVADMYRLVIEHPEWIPAEMQRRLDLRAGADKGRIYRIVRDGAPKRSIPNLAQMNTPALVAALDSSNGWQRDTAQRLLIERQDGTATAPLEQLATKAASAKVRVQALWTLAGLESLRAPVLETVLRDSDPHVREHAVRLAEAQLPALLPHVAALASDTNARVRCQVAFTLGETRDPRAVPVLATLLGDDDATVSNAAASSAAPHAQALLKQPGNGRSQTHLAMLKKLVAAPPAPARANILVERTNVLSAEQRAERAAVLARYRDVPKLAGDSARGRVLFEQNCALCHRHRGLGNEVGPDLGIMSGKDAEQVVIAVLDPNAAVEDRFRSYSIKTRDDRELSGIIVSETPTTLTFRAPNLPDETVLRSDLTEMTGSGLSLMPEGFENAFTPQQLADLVAFVLGR